MFENACVKVVHRGTLTGVKEWWSGMLVLDMFQSPTRLLEVPVQTTHREAWS